MRLTIEALEQQLSHQKLAACYLLVSNESFLVQEARDSIWHAANQQGFSERQIWEVKSQLNWDSLKKCHSNFDLFHRSFLELRCHRSLDVIQGNQLQQLVESLSVNTVLAPMIVVSCEQWPFKMQQSQWFQKLAAMSHFVVINQPSIYQLPYWINQQLHRYQLSLTKDAMSVLVQSIEGNLPAARQAIQKLSLLYEGYEKPLNLEQLGLVLKDEYSFELFHLTDAILQNQPDRCLRMIKHFETTHTPPALVLSYLLKMLRIVSGVRDGLDRQHALPDLFKKYNVWQKQQAGFKKMVERLHTKDILKLFDLAQHIDRCIKGACSESSWHYLQQLSLFLSGGPAPLLEIPLQY